MFLVFVVLKYNETYLFYVPVYAETINEQELNKLNKLYEHNGH